MSSYLLTFDQTQISRDQIVKKIDRISDITNWMFFFDNTACLVSDLSARHLADLIREDVPDAHFIIVEMKNGNRSGWLRKSVWDFIKSPKPVNS